MPVRTRAAAATIKSLPVPRRKRKKPVTQANEEYQPELDEEDSISSDEFLIRPVKRRPRRKACSVKGVKKTNKEKLCPPGCSDAANTPNSIASEVDRAVEGLLKHGGEAEEAQETSFSAKAQCHICDAAFDDPNDLADHLASHHATSSRSRPQSAREGQSAKGKRNVSEACKRGDHVCDICHKKFGQKGHLRNHLRIHTGERPFVCDICEKRFYQSGHLLSHVRSHANIRPYECKICEKRFTQSGHLKNHERVHSGCRPYACSHCGKCFFQSGHLVSHIRLHDGEKPFNCKVCNKKFTQSGHLRTHQKLHSEKASLECEVCHIQFSDRESLACHVVTTHDEKQRFICAICPKSFRSKRSFDSHLEMHRADDIDTTTHEIVVKIENESSQVVCDMPNQLENPEQLEPLPKFEDIFKPEVPYSVAVSPESFTIEKGDFYVKKEQITDNMYEPTMPVSAFLEDIQEIDFASSIIKTMHFPGSEDPTMTTSVDEPFVPEYTLSQL